MLRSHRHANAPETDYVCLSGADKNLGTSSMGTSYLMIEMPQSSDSFVSSQNTHCYAGHPHQSN
jgi:hypothetical protein